MRVIALCALVACQGSPPGLEGGVRHDACYAGKAPADLAATLAGQLRGDGWNDVRIVAGARRTNVVGRRGRESYSASIAPDACGTRVTAGVVTGSGVQANEVGPGGPGPTRL
jgi:hypothetical protein